MNWFLSTFLQKKGLPTLGGMLVTFYVGTKLMFHISDAMKSFHGSLADDTKIYSCPTEQKQHIAANAHLDCYTFSMLEEVFRQ
ncbi:hypothetical protein K7X08_028949 [Anisodus acutangulus]|uniref:Uncharacterized protein n=1 Tax=Anisodus acutangulus TaxID=402998 RepID=A0A9Q1QTA8_9SOLA|nr:hypothetical protein K7X08_028949 [Anisodus acutangulus]